jgi:hypothetical protein
MSEHEVVVAVATYRSKRQANRDLDAVVGAHRGTGPERVAGILVEKGADGRLTIGARHGLPTEAGWPRLLPGAAVTAINAPLGIRLVAAIVPAPAAWTGVAALVAHFWNDVPKHQLRTMSDLLEACQAAVVVVGLDCDEKDVVGRLSDSAITLCAVETSADFEADFAAAIRDSA